MIRTDRGVLLLAPFPKTLRREEAVKGGTGTENFKEMQRFDILRGGDAAAELRESCPLQLLAAERFQTGKVTAPTLAALALSVDLQTSDPCR